MLGFLVTCTLLSQSQAMALRSSFARAAHLPLRCAKKVRLMCCGGARGWRCVSLLFFFAKELIPFAGDGTEPGGQYVSNYPIRPVRFVGAVDEAEDARPRRRRKID